MFLLTICGLLFRVVVAPFLTYQLDFNTFIAWGHQIDTVGLSNFYKTGWSDYLPGYLYILSFLAKIEKLGLFDNVYLYKLPAIIADLLCGILIYKIVFKSTKNKKKALISTSLFIFNPAVFANSTLWGQVDIFTSLTSLGSIYFLNSNIFLSAFLLAFGGLVKPQIAMSLPVIIGLVYKEWSIKKFAFYILLVVTFFIIGFIPFSSSTNNVSFILERINTTLGQYKYTSVNAFNFWGLFGFWRPDNEGQLSPNVLGSLIMIVTSIAVFLKTANTKKDAYFSLFLLFCVNFLFMTRMHERHLLPIFAPLAIAASSNILLIPIYLGFSLTYLANLNYSYLYISKTHSLVWPDNYVNIVIVINLVLLALSVFLYINQKFKINIRNFKNKSKNFSIKDFLTEGQSKKILVAVLFFSFFIRFFNLENPKRYYFDEIYHAFTAKTIAQGDPGVWDWMTRNPPGLAYEWTHPPLAKEIMAGSIKVLGENNFSARLPGSLTGVGIIFLTYLIALRITKSRDIAVFSSILISLDGLILTMSRIATADTYVVFFILFSYYLYLKDKYFFSSVALGLAAATKWTTLWFVPLLVLTHISQRRKIFDWRIVFFLVFPAVIYLASYAPMFYYGYDLTHFWGMQKQMWWYHTGLKATHPYTSSWWTWPFDYRPVYLYQYVGKGLMGDIYAFGNPVFFWFGVLSVFLSFFYLLSKKASRDISLLLFGYLVFFVPWAASPRIMFIYHYLPSIPFMAILSGYILKKHPLLISPIIFSAFILFIYFYPHWTGIPVPEQLANSYYWIKSWR